MTITDRSHMLTCCLVAGFLASGRPAMVLFGSGVALGEAVWLYWGKKHERLGEDTH